MFIMESFAYTDISAELHQYKDKFVVVFKTENFAAISLTLNHAQIKVLADGLTAMANQARVKELLESKSIQDIGDMKVKFRILEGDEEKCQQNILSARTEILPLSETA